MKLLTNLKKNSILDVVEVLDPLLHRMYFTHNRATFLFSLWTIFVLEPRSTLPILKIKGFRNRWTNILWKLGYFLILHKISFKMRVVDNILKLSPEFHFSGTPIRENRGYRTIYYCSEMTTQVFFGES